MTDFGRRATVFLDCDFCELLLYGLEECSVAVGGLRHIGLGAICEAISIIAGSHFTSL